MRARMAGRYFFSSACEYWMYLSSAGKSAAPALFSSAIAPNPYFGIAGDGEGEERRKEKGGRVER
jgi:hypothetical protein